MVWIFSPNDNSIKEMLGKNKIAVLFGGIWAFLFLFKKNTDPDVLKILSKMVILHDVQDVGEFGHLHHWISGYVMDVLSEAKNKPVDKRVWYSILNSLNILNEKARTKFIARGLNVK